MQKIISVSKKILGVSLMLAVAQMAEASPYQFLAKQYTEALGRAPDPGAWAGAISYFASNGCSKTTLNASADAIFGSAEYASRGYDNYEKTLTVFRAVLNRDPDASGFQYWVNYLNNGNSLVSMVDFIFQGMSATTVSQMCGTLGYGWGVGPVLNNATIPVSGSGIANLAALQAALTAATPGSTVYLAQRAVIETSSQIVVPTGVTLATTGLPQRSKYAKQARIVRTALFGSSEIDGGLVRLMSGAKLDSVWISGQRQNLGYSAGLVTVVLQGGTGTTIANSRVENSSGWATIVAHRFGQACKGMIVANNLLTGYSNIHQFQPGYTDGISGNCEAISASANDVVDASDVGIILFPSALDVAQSSQIFNNQVVSAGVPTYGALMMSAMKKGDINGNTSFTGAAMHDNTFWAAPDSHFDIGLAVGGMPWAPEGEGNLGSGGSFTNNTNASIATPMRIGIAVDGMTSTTVQSNSLVRATPSTTIGGGATGSYVFKCPAGANLAHLDAAAGHTLNDSLQGPPVNTVIHACIGH